LKNFWKIFFSKMGVSPFFQIFSGKIFVKVLSPLGGYEKPPYLRGDTGRGEGV
jgi:hypothetical protein